MSYCKEGDKPLVIYQFNGGQQKKYKSSVAPIDVVTSDTPVNATANYSREGFQITFYGYQRATGRTSVIVTDYILYFYAGGNQFDPNRGYYLALLGCGQTNWGGNSNCIYPWDIEMGCLSGSERVEVGVGLFSFDINTNIKCPSPSPQKSKIQIYKNGVLLFQDQGNTPVSFEVQCGNCADGEFECSSPIYPGYCCCSCGDIKGEIIQISNQIRRLN